MRNFVETLKALLMDDTRKPQEKFTAKEKKDLAEMEGKLKHEGDAPSKIDSLLAFLVNDKDKTRALEWIKEKARTTK
jgi:hypothetical protein